MPRGRAPWIGCGSIALARGAAALLEVLDSVVSALPGGTGDEAGTSMRLKRRLLGSWLLKLVSFLVFLASPR